jgi:EAL domain-containing protein (putative c-di-GMP-specific phosphodiesterase class I)
MAKLALLIGVSEYDEAGLNPLPAAVNDVDAIQRVLTNLDRGDFVEADITVLKNPQRQEMEDAIYGLFTKRQKEDLLLFYFSGHGFRDESGKLYLSTRGTRKDNGRLVKPSVVAASFLHEQMNESKSQRQVVILDCCFSGAFAQGMTVKDDGTVNLQEQLGGKGRAILTSSTSTQYSFEQQGTDLSIYTRYLVDGIETGAADQDRDGWISVGELHKYAGSKVQEVVPNMTPKFYPVEEGYSIQLAKSGITSLKRKSEALKSELDFGEVKLGAITKESSYLHNFLEPYQSFIEELISRIKEDKLISHAANNPSNKESEIEKHILDVIRCSSNADFVCILRNNEHNSWVLKSSSHFNENIEPNNCIEILKSNILTKVSAKSIFNVEYHGVYQLYEERRGISKAFALVPLNSRLETEFMVVCGLPQDSYLLGDVYGRILSTFYQSSKKYSYQPTLVENSILDALKRDYGFVSFSLYEKRFNSFCQRLKKMIVYFEPILELESLSISGWEALARDPETLTAPSDLFQAAELWGDRFMIELDQHFLRVGTEIYREARTKINQNRSSDILPLSVNVYPASLMRRAYFETVSQIIKKEHLIPAKKLVLEISEKSELLKEQDVNHLEPSWLSFKKRLETYVREFKIKFAIDDFGVGYASVSRLAGLHPPYVKIDREILHHDSRDIIIQFVHELVGVNNLNPPDIILEGLDEKAPISFHKLKEIGVSYVQGHIVSKAKPEIYRLSKEEYDRLKSLFNNT